MRRCLLAVLLLSALPLPGCGGDDDDAAEGDGDADVDADGDGDGDGNVCALPGDSGEVALHVQVDGLEVLTCVDGRWRLNVRACGEPATPSCAVMAGICSEDVRSRLLGNACDSPVVTMPTAGHYTLCVEAELVNGSYAVEQCKEIDVGPEGLEDRVAFDLDTNETFPCVTDWTYHPRDNECCTQNDQGIFCAPPSY